MRSRREQFLDAAEACFARRGFHATTVADISDAAECSPGLLYRYFAGKDDLVEALVERHTQRYVKWLHAVHAAPDPMAALRELLDRALTDAEFCGDGTVGDRADGDAGLPTRGGATLDLEIAAEAARNPALAAVVRRATADLLDALAEALRAGQGSGAFDRRLDPRGRRQGAVRGRRRTGRAGRPRPGLPAVHADGCRRRPARTPPRAAARRRGPGRADPQERGTT